MRTTVTREYIEKRVDDVSYTVMPGTTITFCLLKMVNGYTVVGKSACANEANFEAAVGRNWAYEDAINNAWPLEGYLLSEELSKRGQQKLSVVK